MKTTAPRGFLAAPSLPLAVALALAPTVVVLQSKAMTPLALIALALSVFAHWYRHGVLPWPRGGAMLAALALGLWGTASALWALQPLHALEMGVTVSAMALLAGGAAVAVTEDDAAAKALVARAVFVGLVVGLSVALADHVSGNAVRALVRGLREVPPSLAIGLKPAASVLGMMLPLAAAMPGIAPWLRVAVLVGGAVVIVLLPGDSAKIAALGGIVVLALAERWPNRVPRAVGFGLGALLLAMPLIVGAVLAQSGLGERLPPSAVHRLVIWDFAVARIAERPLAGWGMEASRAIPGGSGQAAQDALDRIGVRSPGLRAAFALPGVQVMPLHPHNGALQVWLELGLVGAALAALLLVVLGAAAAGAAYPPAAAGALFAAFTTGMLSFGMWQPWWIASELLVVVALAGLPRRA